LSVPSDPLAGDSSDTEVFLSYAREDEERARILKRAIETRGKWSCWWDGDLRAGSRFSPEIQARLNKVGCVVVLWSKNSVNGGYVEDEAKVGRERGVLVPFLLDGSTVPLGFGSLHTRTLSRWDSDGPAELADVLRDIASALKVAAPEQPPPRRKAFLGSAAIVAVILLAGTVAWVASTSTSPEPEIVVTAVEVPSSPSVSEQPDPVPTSPAYNLGEEPSRSRREQ
jgi:hypothetical protein